MNALILDAARQARIGQPPQPDPAPGELRIRVRRCGLCGTDVHIYDGAYELATFPLTPGH